ncbi:MAG: acyl-CoA dehydrogenase family protein, partial [Ignavibacteriaceae bacterium]|nr:acyl-CoA dehydrogenase family protein [Ignavibacteriaceae bacterium]
MEQKPFSSELTENQIIIRDTIKDFAEKNIRPVIMEYDESQKFPMEIMKQLGELGFLGILVPEEYGGAGLGYVEYALIIEELSKVDPSIGLSVAAHNGLCTNHINLFGNDSQRKKYLPDLASGKKIGAWGLTESFSGSDAAGLKSSAIKDGNNWI